MVNSGPVVQKKYMCSTENEEGLVDHRVLKQKWVYNAFTESSLPFENDINTFLLG